MRTLFILCLGLFVMLHGDEAHAFAPPSLFDAEPRAVVHELVPELLRLVKGGRPAKAFNSAARGMKPRFNRAARSGARKNAIKSRSKLSQKFRSASRKQRGRTSYSFNAASRGKGGAVKGFNRANPRARMPKGTAVNAFRRATPPPRTRSAIGHLTGKRPTSFAKTVKGKPAPYLTKKMNRAALGVRSIRNRFNSAVGSAGGSKGSGVKGTNVPALRPPGPRF